MEEADGIIIDNLRKIGCDIEEDVTSLAHFTTEIVIEGAVKCLNSILPDLKLNHRMPPNLPARYKLCMDIAKACKDIGYKGDLGYETFLHGSQAEIRRVFVILIQKLPKVNEQPILESVDSFQDTLKRIRSTILVELHRPWVPSFCHGPPTKHFPFQICDITEQGAKTFNAPTKWIPSLLEKESFELAKEKYPQYKFPARNRIMAQQIVVTPAIADISSSSSRYVLASYLQHSRIESRKMKPPPPPKPTHLGIGSKAKEIQPTKEEQCQQLIAVLENLEREIQQRETDLSEMQNEFRRLKSQAESKELELERREKELERQEKLSSLLPEASVHISRMEKLLDSNAGKMACLEQEWLDIKQPLEDEYNEWLQRRKKSAGEQTKSNLTKSLALLKEVIEEIQTKEDAIQTLQSQLDALPSTALTRTFYTQRILSIVANVKKQNEEMHRVLEDVKSVQREINSLQGKVERTFTVTDEMIFKMAKTDEIARRIYKFLITLHTDCSDILQLVKESGSLSRDIKDLEEQAETEQRKCIKTKLRQVQEDLNEMRMENSALEKKTQSSN